MASQTSIPTPLPWVHKHFVDSQATLIPDPLSHLSRPPSRHNFKFEDIRAPAVPHEPSFPLIPPSRYYFENNDSQAPRAPHSPSLASNSTRWQNPNDDDSQSPSVPYPTSHQSRPPWQHNYNDKYNPSTAQAPPSKPEPRNPKYSYARPTRAPNVPRNPKYRFAQQAPEPIFPLPPSWNRSPPPSPQIPVQPGEHNIHSCLCFSCRASRRVRVAKAESELKEISKIQHAKLVAKNSGQTPRNEVPSPIAPRVKVTVHDDDPAVIPEANNLSKVFERERKRLNPLKAGSQPLKTSREGPNVNDVEKGIPDLTLSPTKVAVNDDVPAAIPKADASSEKQANKRQKPAPSKAYSRPLDTVQVGQSLTKWLEEGGHDVNDVAKGIPNLTLSPKKVAVNGGIAAVTREKDAVSETQANKRRKLDLVDGVIYKANFAVIKKTIPGKELWTCKVWRWIEGLEVPERVGSRGLMQTMDDLEVYRDLDQVD